MIVMIEVLNTLLILLSCINFRAGIRKATAWYNSHISITHPPVRGQTNQALPTVVLMTEDAVNRQKAEQSGIACISGMNARIFFEVQVDLFGAQFESMWKG